MPATAAPTDAIGRSPDDTWRDGVTTEAVAHALLRLAGDFPGQMGRLRAARVVCGYSVGHDGDVPVHLQPYVVEAGWPVREVVALLDALIDGGLVVQTLGARPTLVLTRAGHRALDALEAIDEPPRGRRRR